MMPLASGRVPDDTSMATPTIGTGSKRVFAPFVPSSLKRAEQAARAPQYESIVSQDVHSMNNSRNGSLDAKRLIRHGTVFDDRHSPEAPDYFYRT